MSFLASVARRGAVATVVAALVLAYLTMSGPTGTRPAATTTLDYTPVTGAVFNRPIGTTYQQMAIFRHINNSIDASPAGSTIRIAVYSFALKSTANKLIAAHDRGVNVQIIFDDHTIYTQEQRLQNAFGKNPDARSFVRFCDRSCRGPSGVMHDKIFLFSKAGNAQNITMVGSNNMTRHNAEDQWSDLYTVANDPALYFTFSGIFEQMKYDRVQSPAFVTANVNGYEPQFYPYPELTQSTDPIYKLLSQVSCLGASDGTGVNGKTMLRFSQHAWNGTRGVYLAKKVAALKGQGCDIQVIYGIGMGRAVKTTLRDAGIPMSAGTHAGIRTHQKYILLSGVYAGNTASRIVWNGSHNLTDGAIRRDDIVFKVQGQKPFDQYLANFRDIWFNG